jgi:CDP-diacylglycerol pyrophosphatase
MPDNRSPDRGLTRQWLLGVPRVVSALLASCALVAASPLAGWMSPGAASMAMRVQLAGTWMLPLQPPGQATSDCGSDSDTDELWTDVKDATPQKPEKNVKVVFVAKTPQGHEYGYAIHDGAQGAQASKYNYLLIPTLRERGIECHRIWEPGALNLFGYAFDNLGILPANTDWALGIESSQNRSHDQLHIHVSRLTTGARNDLNKVQSVTNDVKGWNTDVITVQGKSFRALWNKNPKGLWDHNVFDTLAIYVAPNNDPKNPTAAPRMADQTLLVTTYNGGVIALDSDRNSLKNGANNIEFLLNKNP